MATDLRIAVIPGDGIGQEVVPEAVRVLEHAAALHGGLHFAFEVLPWGCDHYQEHGAMMPEDGIEVLSGFDHILLGAVGRPDVPDHVSLWGLLIPIRRAFEQYVNLRPVRLLRGVESPLRGYGPGDIDFVVVRENSEGEYSSMGGRIHEGTPHEVAAQISYFSRMAVERVMRYSFDLAGTRAGTLTAATKSNGIVHTMPFWDQVAKEMAAARGDVHLDLVLVDALAAYFVTRPETFDVVVASNLFADILTDLGGAVMGSIGIAPAANLNPEGTHPSMVEPVHGSAPDVAGLGIANPVGQIWTAKLMLDFIGEGELGTALLASIERALEKGVKTPDIGGRSTTEEVTDAIIDEMNNGSSPVCGSHQI
jgi:tartrate dehydrogenase/decarboxylase / D-malate dehydrogenase